MDGALGWTVAQQMGMEEEIEERFQSSSCARGLSSPAQIPGAVPAPAQLLPSECLTLSHLPLRALLQLQPSSQLLQELCRAAESVQLPQQSSALPWFSLASAAPSQGRDILARQMMLPARQFPWQLPWEMPVSSRGPSQGHCRASPASPGAQRWLWVKFWGQEDGKWQGKGSAESRVRASGAEPLLSCTSFSQGALGTHQLCLGGATSHSEFRAAPSGMESGSADENGRGG